MTEVLGSGLQVGVDVGGTKLLAAVIDGDGQVLASHQRPTPAPQRPAAELTDAVVEAVRWVAEGVRVEAVGIAAAGLVDAAGERVVFAPHLAWRDADVRADLGDRLGVRVALDNDANCAARAESIHGAARGASSAVVLTLGTGIGGAFVVDGRVWRGASGMAGEFGHMVVQPDGLSCECGGSGCWEQYCSGSVVARLAGLEPSTEAGAVLARSARSGDARVRDAYAEVGRWLGRGLANLVAAWDPALVVVGGGASAAGDLLLEPAREHLAHHLVGAGHRPTPPIVPATLGPQAGVIGAAVLAASDLTPPR